jgi:hypothetical protein
MMGMLLFALGGFTLGLIVGVCLGSGFVDDYWRR